jgi:putative transposase
MQDTRAFCGTFFTWYNKEHPHSSIALMTSEQVHYGKSQKVFNGRTQILAETFVKNPLRFKGKLPKPIPLPEAAWINKPKAKELESNL